MLGALAIVIVSLIVIALIGEWAERYADGVYDDDQGR